MALFGKGKMKSRRTKARPETPPETPRAGYYSPNTLRIDDFNLGSPAFQRHQSNVALMDVDALVGASATKTAVYKSKHLDISVFQELNESLHVIEQKFHAGMYDAQAMPLVESFLNEVEGLAQIQVERDAINDCRINDIKAANSAAYQAVYDARVEREKGIEAARAMAVDLMLPDFEIIEQELEERAARRHEKLVAKKERKAEREKSLAQQRANLAAQWSEKRRAAAELAKTRREEKSAAKTEEKEKRRERKVEREARRHEALMQKQQLKLEEKANKQRLAEMKQQQKMDEIQMAVDARKAESLVKQAQADAEVERAKALAQSAKVDKEKARLEEERVKEALKVFDEDAEAKLPDDETASSEDASEESAVLTAPTEEFIEEALDESEVAVSEERESASSEDASLLPAEEAKI